MSIDFLKTLAFAGAEWVIYALLIASVFAAAVIIERAVVLRREMRWFDDLSRSLDKHLESGDIAALAKAARAQAGAASRILADGFSSSARGRASQEDRLVAASLREKRFLESRLLVLGTLGNNAPFIGLFGTVLGVIRAFHDLAQHAGAGPEVVMQGLSEALIATAVGLFVAIPCVISYNYYHKKVQDLLSSTEALSRLILSTVK